MERLIEKLTMKLAYALPRRLAYWAYVRVHSEATVTTHQDKTPDQVTVFDAMKSWGAQS